MVRSFVEADFTKPISIGHKVSVMTCMLYSGGVWFPTSITSIVVHTRKNASATGILSPRLYLTTMSNSLCNLAGASVMFFLNICSSSEWSVSTRVCLPSR